MKSTIPPNIFPSEEPLQSLQLPHWLINFTHYASIVFIVISSILSIAILIILFIYLTQTLQNKKTKLSNKNIRAKKCNSELKNIFQNVTYFFLLSTVLALINAQLFGLANSFLDIWAIGCAANIFVSILSVVISAIFKIKKNPTTASCVLGVCLTMQIIIPLIIRLLLGGVIIIF